jgi:hypothetical protein
MIMDYIDLRWLIGAFCVGLLMVMLFSPKPDVIVRFPSPDNAEVTTYTDDSGTCFQYKATQVKCDDKALPQPLK